MPWLTPLTSIHGTTPHTAARFPKGATGRPRDGSRGGNSRRTTHHKRRHRPEQQGSPRSAPAAAHSIHKPLPLAKQAAASWPSTGTRCPTVARGYGGDVGWRCALASNAWWRVYPPIGAATTYQQQSYPISHGRRRGRACACVRDSWPTPFPKTRGCTSDAVRVRGEVGSAAPAGAGALTDPRRARRGPP